LSKVAALYQSCGTIARAPVEGRLSVARRATDMEAAAVAAPEQTLRERQTAAASQGRSGVPRETASGRIKSIATPDVT
jgi:hypothetical protein